MNPKDAIIVIFSKEQVRRLKLAHFLKQLGPAALPTGPELATMMGKFQFLVDGWNDDPQELYAIPEVRKFYQHFHKVWPYWFYFCDLGTETLTMMTLCLMPNLASFKRLGEPLAKVEYDPADLLPLISRDLGPLNAMMERAGMTELAIYERTRHVFIPTGFQQGADVAFQLVFIRQVHGAMGRRVVRSDILLPAAVPQSCRAPSARRAAPYLRAILGTVRPLACGLNGSKTALE